ncbi:hypothetical protein [Thermococcus sp.]|uniref:hypothetical protein n=1 Tax=Thermococcus sp. TaxID=35749 RepID=UPI002634D48C|nr:hypothetical protein [Thermococcus sp.]
MTTLEDIRLLVERGFYEEALEKITELLHPVDQVKALGYLAFVLAREGGYDWVSDVISDSIYIADKIKGAAEKAVAYAIIGSTLSILDYEEDSVEMFSKALDQAERIKDPITKGRVLSRLAYRLAISGHSETAIDLFNTAFDTIIGAEIKYTEKVDGLIRTGELMEKAGDALTAKDAMRFYGMAFDIFDKLHVNQRAAIVEKKIELCRTVMDVGLPEIRAALLEGRNRYALALIERKYHGVMRFLGELEVAMWMKRVNNREYLDVIERAFQESKDIRLTESNVQRIATILTDLGSLRRALEFASMISDVRQKSEALKAIALELGKRREFEEAFKLTEGIPDEEVRGEVITELTAMRGAGETI